MPPKQNMIFLCPNCDNLIVGYECLVHHFYCVKSTIKKDEIKK